MRRLIALIVLFVFGSVAYADYEMSDSEKERYLKWAGKSSGADFALAVSPNGCYGMAVLCNGCFQISWQSTLKILKRDALRSCKWKCKSSACKIMDVNGYSPYIKQRGSSSSSPTVSTPTPAQKPTLTIRSSPTDAKVYIGGAYKGTTELKVKLPLGNYSLRVERSGYNNFNQQIELKKDMVLWASLSKKEKQKPEPKPEPKPKPKYKLIGTGTGFAVNKYYVVTAEHVLEECNAVSILHGHKEIGAQTAASDTSNDLGLIRLVKPLPNTAKLRGGKRVRLGEMVANYGYPLFGQLSTSATITEGNINNLSGAGNDSTVLQFDAPTQPGNSGGPVLDSSGNVVGVAIQGLSKKYADATGHIAQNVNFAVKSNIVENFLSSNNVPYEKSDSREKLELPDIAEKAERFTVLVGCWQ